MERPFLINTDIISIIKWAISIASATILILGRFIFSHFYKKFEIMEKDMADMKILLTKISTKLEIEK